MDFWLQFALPIGAFILYVFYMEKTKENLTDVLAVWGIVFIAIVLLALNKG